MIHDRISYRIFGLSGGKVDPFFVDVWKSKEERYTQLVEYFRGSRIGPLVYALRFNTNDKRGLQQ